MEEKKKERQNRKENWLHTGIVVKIITKKLGQKYHKSKAVVKVCMVKITFYHKWKLFKCYQYELKNNFVCVLSMQIILFRR